MEGMPMPSSAGGGQAGGGYEAALAKFVQILEEGRHSRGPRAPVNALHSRHDDRHRRG